MAKLLTLMVSIAVALAHVSLAYAAPRALSLSSSAYLVIDPYHYDPAEPYAGGQNRGVDVIAADGVARAATDGQVMFSGQVAGRGVVTVRALIEALPVVITYTGVANTSLHPGQTLHAGDVVGRAITLHIGAYDAANHHVYMPVTVARGGDDVDVLPSGAGPAEAAHGPVSPIASSVLRRLRSAIDGTARLVLPRALHPQMSRVVSGMPVGRDSFVLADSSLSIRPRSHAVNPGAKRGSRKLRSSRHRDTSVPVNAVSLAVRSVTAALDHRALAQTPTTRHEARDQPNPPRVPAASSVSEQATLDVLDELAQPARTNTRSLPGVRLRGGSAVASSRMSSTSPVLSGAQQLAREQVAPDSIDANAVHARSVRSESGVRHGDRGLQLRQHRSWLVYLVAACGALAGLLALIAVKTLRAARGQQPLEAIHVWLIRMPHVRASPLRRSRRDGGEAERVRLPQTNGSESRREHRRPREPA